MGEQTWKGSADLSDRLVPVRELVTHPRNPRRGKVALIAESLTRFGQVRPVLVSGNRIVAGNHTYLAACELGWTHVAVSKNDFADEAEAAAYLLADNRLGELGSYAPEQHLALLGELEATGEWAGTGYDPDVLDDLRAAHGAVPETDQAEFLGGFAADPETLAARQQHLGQGTSFRELVLMLDTPAAAAFDNHLRVLKKEYGGGIGVTDSVVRAILNQAAAV